MANKQTALRSKKQEKRQAAAKQKKRKANIERNALAQFLGRREEARMMAGIAAEGVHATAHKEMYRRHATGETIKPSELTNKDVMASLSEVFGPLMRLHAGVELFDRLAKEKRFELTDAHKELMDHTDELVVPILEDINAITQFIEAEQPPAAYADVYTHVVQLLAQMATDVQPAVITMLQTQKDLIDQYAHEHRGNTPMFAYQQQLHGLRMLRVGPIYATKYAADQAEAQARADHAYTPETPQPLDPVEPVLLVEPDLERDVETGRGQTPSTSIYEDIGGIPAADASTEQPQ